MKKLVVYSSRSGNTKQLAQAIAQALEPDCMISPADLAPAPEKFDFIAFGSGIYRGWPDGEMRSYMLRAKPRFAGVFLTSGTAPEADSTTLYLGRMEGMLPCSKTIVRFACQGAYTPEMIERMKNRASNSPHAWNAERASRVASAANHPNATDLDNARNIFKTALAKVTLPPRDGKEAVLVAWFGSSISEATQAYDTVESLLPPGARRAYLSQFIRKKLGGTVPSPTMALQQLYLEGVRRVKVLAGVLTPGEEYDRLGLELNAFRHPAIGFDSILTTLPPLASPKLLHRFLDAVATELPDQPIIFMGHGHADGRSDFRYDAVASELAKRNRHWYLACVEGGRTLEPLILQLKRQGIQQVELRPFMLVAGDHAHNDLTGDTPDSWKSQLEAVGIATTTRLRGLATYPAVAHYFAQELENLSE